MASFAWFLLVLFVFLQSAVYLAWFAVDPKLLGYVGVAFVVVAILEAVWYTKGHPNWWRGQA